MCGVLIILYPKPYIYIYVFYIGDYNPNPSTIVSIFLSSITIYPIFYLLKGRRLPQGSGLLGPLSVKLLHPDLDCCSGT